MRCLAGQLVMSCGREQDPTSHLADQGKHAALAVGNVKKLSGERRVPHKEYGRDLLLI